MSHFLVLVLGDDVTRQLAPFHEFECTGQDDEYVKDLDVTEKYREEYEKHTTTVYKDPEGAYHKRFTPEGEWDPRFWRDPTPEESLEIKGSNYGTGIGFEYDKANWDGGEYRAKVKQLPEGWSETSIPTKEIETFEEYLSDEKPLVAFGTNPDLEKKHKYGYTLLNEDGTVLKIINRTNPNSKWDWYSIGGRWEGFFKLKPGATGELGEPGIQTMNENYKAPAPDRADVCRKGDIDVEGMKGEAGEAAAKVYDMVASVLDGHPKVTSWEATIASHTDEAGVTDWGSAREAYNSQPAVKALHAHREACWYNAGDFECTREEYILQARNRAIVPLAIVKEGQWYERGTMGWWGILRNESDRDEWNAKFNEMFDAIPDDVYVTAVDCHI